MKGWMRVMTIGLTAVVAVTVGLPLLPVFQPRAALACVVGTGTSASCTEVALNACLPHGGGFDGTVTFNCGGSATITVTATKTIDSNTSIDGGGLITISGGGSKRVFLVSATFDFSVQNLTIANGFSASGAGAIDTGSGSGGTLTVTNSTFSGNASCISGQNRTMIITNSTFSGNSASGGGNGGALKVGNGTTMSVTSSTFSGNSAGVNGGAINNNGALTVTNSTFSGNSAVGGGGVIYNNASGTVTITNSTFSGNSAGSGVVIANAGGVTVTNSILANSTPAGSNCSGAHAPVDGGNNIDDGATCGFTGTGCSNTSGTSFCNTNPVLDPTGLQNNGGPTQTIALVAVSPAINAGNESVCAASPVNSLDQRGFGRPGTGHANCSIGAYEADAAIPALSGWGVVAFSGLALIFILWRARRHPRRFAAA